MEISLAAHIRQTVPFGADELTLAPFLEVHRVPRRDHLKLPDSGRGTLVFVESGLLRLYSLDAQTRERTHQFGVEGCWVGGTRAFETEGASIVLWQAVEDSRVVVLPSEGYQKLLEAHPRLERYFLRVAQRAATAARRRSHLLANANGEERYWRFQRRYRSFVQRVPQHMLASFLGFTPEWLSKIRGRNYAAP